MWKGGRLGGREGVGCVGGGGERERVGLLIHVLSGLTFMVPWPGVEPATLALGMSGQCSNQLSYLVRACFSFINWLI